MPCSFGLRNGGSPSSSPQAWRASASMLASERASCASVSGLRRGSIARNAPVAASSGSPATSRSDATAGGLARDFLHPPRTIYSRPDTFAWSPKHDRRPRDREPAGGRVKPDARSSGTTKGTCSARRCPRPIVRACPDRWGSAKAADQRTECARNSPPAARPRSILPENYGLGVWAWLDDTDRCGRLAFPHGEPPAASSACIDQAGRRSSRHLPCWRGLWPCTVCSSFALLRVAFRSEGTTWLRGPATST